MVMKGGVTSGIVYPAAILRIAQRFKLKKVGGTSAGAIAAAMAAAAEFRRASDAVNPGAGYVAFKNNIMVWLGQGTNLQSLFVPVRSLAPLFSIFLFLVGASVAKRRVAFAAGIVVLALLVYGVLAAFVGGPDWWLFDAAKIFAIVVIVATIAGVALLIVAVTRWLPLSNFGICTGGRAGTSGRVEPLTFWLSRQIDTIANTGEGRPLTFGDLWAGRLRPQPLAEGGTNARPDDPVVDLQMVTTCLTLGRPFMLPLSTAIFYFREDELRRFFPEYVVDWIVKTSRSAASLNSEQAQRHEYLLQQGFRPLPLGADLPVVLATRMSLSFPILLSAVRLWTVDWTRPYNQAHRTAPLIEPAWFSDGGVSSNFPIGMFDAPLPTRPTLGITLDDFPPVDPGSDPNADPSGASIANTNDDNINTSWTRFSSAMRPSNLGGFVGAIINAMQNWQDAMQASAPAFRDRIAHVHLTGKQGGLNLAMPPDVIATLVARGELAGKLLIDHFALPSPPGVVTTWHNHRRVRVRTTLDVGERYASAFEGAWKQPGTPSEMSYPDVVDDMQQGPGGYRWRSPEQHQEAKRVAAALAAVVAATPPADPVNDGAPRPVSDLRARPRF